MDLITHREAAERIGITSGTLYMWRSQHDTKGPDYYKVGGLIKYDPADIDAWLDTCRVAKS